MRRSIALVAALLLVTAACGGSTATTDSTAGTSTPATTATSVATTTTAATTTTTDPGFVVTSEDRLVSIEVTPDALSEDPGITITRVPPDETPEEMADLDLPPLVYTLEPDGLEFDAPVRVSMRVGIEDLVTEGFEDAIPLATLITTDEDGWRFLDDMRIIRDETHVTVSGLTDHFSGLALVQEQIFLETRFIEVTLDRTQTLGFEFLWSNGVPLTPPELTSSIFAPLDQQPGAEPPQVSFADGLVTLTCPPGITTTIGDLDLEFLLRTVSDVSGETGIVSAPKVATLNDTEATITVTTGLQLLCRPVITDDGSITIDMQVDHPGGVEIIPGEEFKGGLSAIYMDLGLGLPPLFVGLIRDVDSDGQIGPNDVMYPPEATEINEGASTVVLPLFGFGDYFPYLLSDLPTTELQTEVLVRDGATILLGGLMPEETAVPILDGVPFLARVFGDESRQTAETELVIFVTPRIVGQTEE